ncbi:DUF2147 domain-containing protein [Sphingomonas sp. A2-49]|uniref:DUF2147 domain-containing protein n=1 Tax=Sphingomonas sp. A2-49 TaxID=1391375 RepID=UPI0021D331CE|nr:DUF2147 domain-containing protein [Sphingomonas sp. A2-49]MCU6455334.1 DUF2147 domain-containing protein [Sphingomonas sp. A2-49]
MKTGLATIAAVTMTLIGAGVPAAGAGTAALPSDAPIGRWTNPKGTLAVETGPCVRGGLCGQIVWASERAQAEARQAGIADLIGTQLLQDYRRVGTGSWTGRVYVPDMGRSFSSRIRQTSAATLSISGCLVDGLLCKSQVWHRVA